MWSKEQMRLNVPEDVPTGQPIQDPRLLAYQLHRRFAERLVRSFYRHEDPAAEDER